ncbi:MAG: ABC transporter ATP-binding protein [Sphaerochaetaceae bacterium]|nr:ABC transporter ATP-binding protein [Sphaerochaetaceae bacterium]
MPALDLINVSKIFGSVKAVDGLNLKVEQGECFSFLGPSGCGKTTTLRMIAGFENLDEGELYCDGRLFSSSYKRFYLPPEKRDFGMVFQAFAVWPHMTVYDNVAFPLHLKRLPKQEIQERTVMALKATSLTKEAELYPQKLSGGQQQRIALARAVAINPKVMLLDEPLSNLDPHLREEMRFEIKELQTKFGFTVIYVTHDQAEAMALSDRMLVMKEGVVQQIDAPLNIYDNPANKFVFSFIGLSDFIPVIVKAGRIFVDGAEACGPVNGSIPSGYDPSMAYDIACRPGEIDFCSSGVEATVLRRTYLGDIVDYLLRIGDVNLRVQKPRRQSLAKVGETCHLKFNRLLWYDRNERTASKT